MNSIGRRLKNLRNAQGLSQEFMAKSMGVSLKVYQKYEDGITPISLDAVSLLAMKHSLNINWFLLGIGPMVNDYTKKWE
ncbi:MAG: helix-turn-helix domain-containing protein [Planctomycetia bacterium]|nr:helix-turn-helix domain-containing protein [Planctomycetia bacterium]